MLSSTRARQVETALTIRLVRGRKLYHRPHRPRWSAGSLMSRAWASLAFSIPLDRPSVESAAARGDSEGLDAVPLGEAPCRANARTWVVPLLVVGLRLVKVFSGMTLRGKISRPNTSRAF
jgi:hypothetical protein